MLIPKPEYDEQHYINYVLKKTKIGSIIKAPADLYLRDHDNGEKTDRLIIAYYPHYVVTKNPLGLCESYTYYDMWKILKGLRYDLTDNMKGRGFSQELREALKED